MDEAARLYAASRLVEAAQCCAGVIADMPGHFEAHHLLGVINLDLGRHETALDTLRRAVGLNPRSGRARYHLGNALQALQRHAETESCFRAALALQPAFPEALNNLGNALRALGRDEDAVACYQAALQHGPDNAPALFNMGLSLSRLGRLAEAEASLRAALTGQVKPEEAHRLAEVHDALAVVLVELARDTEALDATQAALRLNPDHPQAEWNASLLLLRMGRFGEAWPKYERRWVLPGFREGADAAAPPPSVLSLDQVAGRRVLVRPEQGRGDIIQFARYAPLLAQRAGGVILSVFPDLVRLMRGLRGTEAVIDDTDPAPPHDMETALLSLPLAFATALDTIPAEVPYLAAEPDLRAAWAERLGPRIAPRVGLCWWGSQHIPERSIPLDRLAPVLRLSGIAFHAVQKDMTDTDRAWLTAHGAIADHGPALTDFAQTAALLSHMDLVISIDTAVAHLAGALARPTWVLLRRSADWRWLLHRADSPWYPTARLFRQDARGAWDPVIAAVAEALDGWKAG